MERDGGGGVDRGHRVRLSFPRAWLPRVRNPASAPSYGEPARANAHGRPGQFALAAPGFFARQTRARMTEGPSLCSTRHHNQCPAIDLWDMISLPGEGPQRAAPPPLNISVPRASSARERPFPYRLNRRLKRFPVGPSLGAARRPLPSGRSNKNYPGGVGLSPFVLALNCDSSVVSMKTLQLRSLNGKTDCDGCAYINWSNSASKDASAA